MRKAEALWTQHSDGLVKSVADQFDYYGKLASQFPIPKLRVVYAKAGIHPAACVLRDTDAVIDHKLYWAAPSGEREAHYLCAILNSETARGQAEQFQSRGLFGARDFDKVMFNLPIPAYDQGEKLHRDLAAAGARAERAAADVVLPDDVKFQRARAMIRSALTEAGIAGRIDTMVKTLLADA